MLITNRWHITMFKWNNTKSKRLICQHIKARLYCLQIENSNHFSIAENKFFTNYCSYNAMLWTITECYITTSSRDFTFLTNVCRGKCFSTQKSSNYPRTKTLSELACNVLLSIGIAWINKWSKLFFCLLYDIR